MGLREIVLGAALALGSSYATSPIQTAYAQDVQAKQAAERCTVAARQDDRTLKLVKGQWLSDSEAEFITRLSDVSEMPEGRETSQEGLAQKLLGIDTKRRASDRFLLESNVLSQKALAEIIRYLEKTVATYEELTGIPLTKELARRHPYHFVLLPEMTYRTFLEKGVADERLRKRLISSQGCPLAQIPAVRGLEGHLISLRVSTTAGDDAEPDARARCVDDLVFYKTAARLGHPLGEALGDWYCYVFFNQTGNTWEDSAETARSRGPIGRPDPDWIRWCKEATLFGELQTPEWASQLPDPTLVEVIRAPVNTRNPLQFAKAWAFLDYVLLTRRADWKKFVADSNSFRGAKGPDNLRVLTERALEKAFGAKVEHEFADFLRSRFPNPDAEKRRDAYMELAAIFDSASREFEKKGDLETAQALASVSMGYALKEARRAGEERDGTLLQRLQQANPVRDLVRADLKPILELHERCEKLLSAAGDADTRLLAGLRAEARYLEGSVRALRRINDARASATWLRNDLAERASLPPVGYSHRFSQNAVSRAMDFAPESSVSVPSYPSEGLSASRDATFVTGFMPGDAVTLCLRTFLHRTGFLNPGLQRVGIGYIHSERDVTVFIKGGDVEESSGAVIYPGAEMKDVPIRASREEPAITAKTLVDYGMPLTVSFFGQLRRSALETSDWKCTLTESGTGSLKYRISTPVAPANREAATDNAGSICVFAEAPLRKATKYVLVVEGTLDGERRKLTTSFTTTR